MKNILKTTAFNPYCATQIAFLESNLEGKFCLALRLSPDDKGEEETHHEDDTEGYDVPHSSASLHCQHTECEDQRSCRSTYVLILFHEQFCKSAM